MRETASLKKRGGYGQRSRHRVNVTPFRMHCIQKGWVKSREVCTGLRISPATLHRALTGSGVGEHVIAAVVENFGPDSYSEIFRVES